MDVDRINIGDFVIIPESYMPDKSGNTMAKVSLEVIGKFQDLTICLYDGGSQLGAHDAYDFGVDPKFIGQNIYVAYDFEIADIDTSKQESLSDTVTTTEASGGLRCHKCNTHYPYAEANQDDGSFVCWSCRSGW